MGCKRPVSQKEVTCLKTRPKQVYFTTAGYSRADRNLKTEKFNSYKAQYKLCSLVSGENVIQDRTFSYSYELCEFPRKLLLSMET